MSYNFRFSSKYLAKRSGIIIFLSAVSIYLFVFLLLNNEPLFTKYTPPDQNYYLETSKAIADGQLLGDNPFRSPLYPYILALFRKLSEEQFDVLVRLTQILTGACSALLILGISRHLYGSMAGLYSSILYIGYWPLALFHNDLLTESLFIFFLLLFLYMLLPTPNSRKTQTLVWAGFILSMATLLRPNALIFFPIAAIYLVRGRESMDIRSWAIRLSALMAGFLILLSLNTYRNYVQSGQFVPLSDQLGINFFIGNHLQATGFTVEVPGLAADWDYAALNQYTAARVGKRLTYAEVKEYWNDQSLRIVFERPVWFLAHLLKKSILFLNNYEIPNTRVPYQMRENNLVLRLLPVNFSFLLGFALVGIVLSDWKNSYFQFLFGCLLLLSIGIVMFFICSRYRLPVAALLAVFSGAGISLLSREILHKNIKKAAVCIIAGLLIFTFSNREVYGINNSNFEIFTDYVHAKVALEVQDRKTAEFYLLKLVRRWPNDHESQLILGDIYFQEGGYTRALVRYRYVYNNAIGQYKTRAYNSINMVKSVMASEETH